MLLWFTLERYRPSYFRTICTSRLTMNLSSWKKFTDPRKREHQHEIITLSKCRLWARNSWSLGLWDCGIIDTLEDLREWIYRLICSILKLCHLLQVLEWDVQSLWKGTAAPTVCYGLPYGSEGGDPAAAGRTRGPGRSKTRSFLFISFWCLFLDNHCSMNTSHDSGYVNTAT